MPKTKGVRGPPRPVAVVRQIITALKKQHPSAFTELAFRNPYELLVATILSAQCTDERVNQLTAALFERYPTPAALSRATPEELEFQIRPTGFFLLQGPIAARDGDGANRAPCRSGSRADGGSR